MEKKEKYYSSMQKEKKVKFKLDSIGIDACDLVATPAMEILLMSGRYSSSFLDKVPTIHWFYSSQME